MYINKYAYVHLVHALVTSIFVSYRNSCYSLALSLPHSLCWFTFISLFPLLHVPTSHMTIILSLSLSLSVLCVYFIAACLFVRTLNSVDVCLWHILHYFIFALLSISCIHALAHAHVKEISS
jgi:hypothetical protein